MTIIIPDTPANQAAPIDGQRATYVYTGYGLTPYATPTDWILLQGSATKTVRVTRFELRGYATAVAYLQYHLVLRTADDGTGTRSSQVASVAQYNSADPAPTGVVFLYTVVPGTLGAGIDVRSGRILLQSVTAAAVANTDMTSLIEYGTRPSHAITLNGVAQQLALNFNSVAVVSGAVYDVLIEWTES